jgi:hypothetical protein
VMARGGGGGAGDRKGWLVCTGRVREVCRTHVWARGGVSVARARGLSLYASRPVQPRGAHAHAPAPASLAEARPAAAGCLRGGSGGVAGGRRAPGRLLVYFAFCSFVFVGRLLTRIITKILPVLYS